jgi:ATP-binding cassette subfamily F protein 3
MSLLTVTNLGQSFGGSDIFSGISFSIPDDARIGLVGPNGIGKTSLLQILVGVATPKHGSVQIARGRTLGYLRQEAVDAFAARDHTVYAEMLTVFAVVLQHAAELRAMETQMADGDHSPELMTRYSAAQESFEREGGYDYEVRIAQVLEGLGFPRAQWEMPLRHLSGGQKTRALLARLLLEAPDLLILDEPTNHLDVEAVEWLERTLRNWKGALLVVSHDRYFLDAVADRIWEMSRQGMELYRGNYTAYVRQRQERWERREQVYEAEKERLEKEIEYIRRNIAGQNTNIAKGKLKRLSRSWWLLPLWAWKAR